MINSAHAKVGRMLGIGKVPGAILILDPVLCFNRANPDGAGSPDGPSGLHVRSQPTNW